MLRFSLLLLQREPVFFFLPALLPKLRLTFCFQLFLLQLQRLLRLCADPRPADLPAGLTLGTFGIFSMRLDPRGDGRAETQRRIVS